MSHTMKSKAKIKYTELDLIKRVGQNLNIKVQELNNYKMYDGNIVSGIGIYLPGWKFPAVLTKNNELVYDNYNGAWGKDSELEKFNNEYSAETQRRYMRECGINWEEHKDPKTGAIEMTIEV